MKVANHNAKVDDAKAHEKYMAHFDATDEYLDELGKTDSDEEHEKLMKAINTMSKDEVEKYFKDKSDRIDAAERRRDDRIDKINREIDEKYAGKYKKFHVIG